MQGYILSAGRAQSMILGDDGERYTFTPLGWRDNSTTPEVGMKVEFEVQGSEAVGIHSIQGAAPPPSPVQPTPVPPTMQGAPTGQPPTQALPPTQPAGAPPPTPPTAQSAPPVQPPSPPPPPSRGFRMNWWYWAIGGGGALVILGVVGAFAMGVFPTSDPRTENEVARQTPAVSATAGASESQLNDGGSQSEQGTASASSDSQTDGKPADYDRVYKATYADTYREYYNRMYDEALARLGSRKLTDKQKSNIERNSKRVAERYASAYSEKYAMGRSIPFAEKYAELIKGGDSPERAAAYAEVYVSTGSKGDAYAFANRIENGELKDYAKQIDSGKSHKYALAYAQQIEDGKSVEYAAAYAQQIEDGSSEETAAAHARQIEDGNTEEYTDSHEFKLEWQTSATGVEAGESFTLNVRMYDVQEAGDHGGITVSFPSLTQAGGSKERHSSSVADVEAVEYTSGLSKVTFHQPGATIYHRENDRQFPSEYLLVESDDASWSRSDDRTLRLRITPKRGEEFPIQIRGWLCADEYTDCSRNPAEGAETDQQGWVVEVVSISVEGSSAAVEVSASTPTATQEDSTQTPIEDEISYAFQNFHVIWTPLDEYGDHDAECKSRLGNQYQLADWNDLTSWVSGGGSVPELIAGLRLKKEGDPASIYPHDGAEIDGRHPRVSFNGKERLNGGRRHFFISRHDHILPGYFAAHAHIDNYHISLGSWYGEGATVLCYNSSPTALSASGPATAPTPAAAPVPDPAEAAGRIAFQSDREGNWEIYVMNADGSDVTRLTDNLADDYFPTWSPDVRRIAFTSRREDNWEIYVVNADGSGLTRLTDNSVDDAAPSWSPDGRYIAFASRRDGTEEIYAMNVDGSGVIRLTDNESLDIGPSWSPDGRRIAFYSTRDGDFEIYIMNANGSRVTRLTDNESQDVGPSWSPDGRRIAFNSNRDGGFEIYIPHFPYQPCRACRNQQRNYLM